MGDECYTILCGNCFRKDNCPHKELLDAVGCEVRRNIMGVNLWSFHPIIMKGER